MEPVPADLYSLLLFWKSSADSIAAGRQKYPYTSDTQRDEWIEWLDNGGSRGGEWTIFEDHIDVRPKVSDNFLHLTQDVLTNIDHYFPDVDTSPIIEFRKVAEALRWPVPIGPPSVDRFEELHSRATAIVERLISKLNHQTELPLRATTEPNAKDRMDFDDKGCRIKLDDDWHDVTENAFTLLKACWEKYPKPAFANHLEGAIKPERVQKSLARQLQAVFRSAKGRGCWLDL